MQKTQLTVLINQLELSIAHIGEPEDEYNKGIVVAYQSCLETAIELLPKEKEDMQDMAEYGHAEYEKWTINAENIFEQNFTQYKP